MPARRLDFEAVRAVGLELPGVEEGTTYGTPALKVRGQMFACLACHKSVEPETLAVRIDFAERDELIAADPGTYYLTTTWTTRPSSCACPASIPMRSGIC